jgi:2-polyprenyl-3-methyl-5-hydroxy-6-metoxy-1,4-benzoquinol methylase
MSTEIASSYWKGQGQYPFDFTRRRRLHELNYLVPRLNEIEGRRLLDLGCGDGSLLECLLRLTDFEEFYGVDIAADLMRDIDPRVKTSVFDIASPSPLPEVDALICAGVIQYVFDDTTVADLFGRLKAPVIWVRSTCTLKPERENVHRGDYASSYRTVPETHALISEHFEVTAVDRVYPDEVESKFGTKQFYFEARQRA